MATTPTTPPMDPTGSTAGPAFSSGIVIIIIAIMVVIVVVIVEVIIVDDDDLGPFWCGGHPARPRKARQHDNMKRTAPLAQCASFSVTPPPMMSATPSQRPRLDGSPRSHMPTRNVPAAPLPV